MVLIYIIYIYIQSYLGLETNKHNWGAPLCKKHKLEQLKPCLFLGLLEVSSHFPKEIERTLSGILPKEIERTLSGILAGCFEHFYFYSLAVGS